jgi:hypothetical protein
MSINSPASIRQLLLNISREQKINFNRILTNYGLERLLYRISVSKYKQTPLDAGYGKFVLPSPKIKFKL